jgi:putative transcriptional regulator
MEAQEGTEPMAHEPMTLEQIRATRRMADLAKIAATTEEDIRRHQIEDGEDPDAPLPPFRPVQNVRAIRMRLQMTQEAFAKAIGVPVATVRNWEQSRTSMDAAVRSLLRVVEREPAAALRALAGYSDCGS